MALPLGTSFDLSNLMGGVNLSPDPSQFLGASGTQTFMPASGAGGSGGASSAMGGASMGIAIGQAVGSMYSAWRGSKSLKAVMKSQARIAEMNRQMAQLSAESAYRQGESQVAQLTYRAGQIKAQQRAGFGKSGIVGGVGSSQEIMASGDVMKQIDMKNAELNAISAAWGYKQEAIQQNGQAQMQAAMSGAVSKAAIGQGFVDFLEDGYGVAKRWYSFRGAS